MTNTTMTLREELDHMHAGYVDAVNAAVESDDLSLAAELGAAYDDEATTLVAEREGRTDLLPLVRAAQARTRKGDATHDWAGWLRRAS